jgi:hypothetical protein
MSDETVDLVSVQRINDLEPLVCRVYLSTNECIVASELSDSLDLDGIFIIPTNTVRYFDRAFEKADLYRAALGAWSISNAHTALLGEFACSLVEDLRLLARRGDTVAIFMEMEVPDVCYVGTIREVSDAKLLLDRISSRGELIDDPLEVDLKTITKIEVSTRYLIAMGYAARSLAGR